MNVDTALVRAAARDLAPAGLRDFEWVRRLLAPTELPGGLVSLLALEAAVGLERNPPPCLKTWLEILDALTGIDASVFALREALALALDARQMVREAVFELPGKSLPDPAEAVRMLQGETAFALYLAKQIVERRTTFSAVSA